MSTRIEFLIKAIEEVQETNRFLDTKAGILVVFQSSLLLVIVSNVLDTSRLQLIKNMTSGGAEVYLALLAIYFFAYVVALIIHILITLKVIYPSENPELHVNRGDFEPKRLFFLHRWDRQQRIQPSVPEYFARLATMSDGDITKEYIFELMKLSCIRKIKSDGLALSFKYLNVLIIGIAVFGLVLALGELIY